MQDFSCRCFSHIWHLLYEKFCKERLLGRRSFALLWANEGTTGTSCEALYMEVIMIDILILVAILAINVAISVWNCYVIGTAWRDVQALGSGFDKLILWSALVQSGVGFSMPILLGLAFMANALLTAGADPTLTAEEGRLMLEWIFSLWYVAIIFPILGTGLVIWLHSIRVALERRDFTSIAAAGWNSFAQIHNMYSAWQNVGPAMGNVGEIFSALGSSKGGDARGKVAVLVIAIVILALIGGFMMAFGLVRYFMSRHTSRIEQHANELRTRA